MANDSDHLSKTDLVNYYYESSSFLEVGRHLESCAECRNDYALLRSNLDWVAADYKQEALQGLVPHFFSRQTQAIMTQVRAQSLVKPFLLIWRWPYAVGVAMLLLVFTVTLTHYVRQRQYDRLWNEAHAVVREMGPSMLGPMEFSSVFDEGGVNPGFPVGPESLDPVEALSDFK